MTLFLRHVPAGIVNTEFEHVQKYRPFNDK